MCTRNTRNTRKRLTFSLGVALVVVTTASFAPIEKVQAAASSNTLEEVIVTGSRLRKENIEESPIAVTVVSQETLDELNLVDLDQIDDIIPSLDLGTNRSGTMLIRGIGSGGDVGFDSSVSLVIDDIPFSRGAWLNPAYFDVAAIEVLKGPQGLYLGKNATAGAIWVRTNEPTDDPEFSATVGHEFDADEYSIEAIASGPLADNFRARLALRYSDEDGWFKDPVEGKKSPRPEEKMGRLTLSWDITDNITNVTKITYNKRTDGGINGVIQKANCPTGSPQPVLGVVPDTLDDCKLDYTGFLDGNAPPDYASLGTGRFWDHKSWIVSNRLEWSLGQFLLTSITGASDYKMTHQDDYDYASPGVIYALEVNQQRQYNQELRLLSQFDGPVNFLAGAFWEDTNFDYRQSSVLFAQPFWDALFGGAVSGADPRNGRHFTWDRTNAQDGRAWGAYAELNWDITDTLRLDVGGRYTDVSKDQFVVNTFVNVVHAALFSLRPEGDSLTDKYDDTDFSPQVTLSWQASDDILVFASYTEAFKAGGFAHGATLQSQTVDDLNFDAESVKGYNLGIKMRLLDQRMFLSAVVYDNDFTDLQQQQFNSATFAFTVANVGSDRSRGLDVDVMWDLNENWRLSGSFAIMDSKIKDYVGTCFAGQTVEQGCDIGYNPATYNPATNSPRGRAQVRDGAKLAPDFEATGSVTYYNTFANDYGLAIGLSVRHKDKFNTQPQRMFPTPSYTRFDAFARVTGPGQKWEATLYSRNLTDKLIYTAGGDIPGTGGTSGLPESDPDAGRWADRNAEVQAPREIGLTLTVRM